MSGHSIAYHLRTNKFVERRMFLDVLARVRIWNKASEYFYASMGGQFLEDFRYVNDHLGIEKMLSLEVDESIWNRQLFNQPFGFLECTFDSSSAFVQGFDVTVAKHENCKFIVWLDFVKASERYQQLQEFSELVSKMGPGDVAKITINANFSSKAKRSDFSSKHLHETFLLHESRDEFGEFTPLGGLAKKHLKPEAYAKFLADAVRIAAIKGTESAGDVAAVPLQVCRYSDGAHQMLTVCLTLADESIETAIEEDTAFKRSGIRSFTWDNIHYINVPHLSWLERKLINSKIGKKSEEEIHDEFGFLFSDTRESSLECIKSYIRHYRRYPSFAPVAST